MKTWKEKYDQANNLVKTSMLANSWSKINGKYISYGEMQNMLDRGEANKELIEKISLRYEMTK